MGRQNQQRRASKKRRRERQRARPRPQATGGKGQRTGSGDASGPRVEDAVWAAVGSLRPRTPAAEDALDALASYGRTAVTATSGLLDRSLGAARWRGWSTADIGHVVTQRLSPAHAGVAAQPGLGQPESVHEVLRLLVEVLALVCRLPDVPAVGPPGSAPQAEAHGLDARVLGRVRGLLRKAESTTFPEEAEALTAKAQELIVRHAIDALLLRGGDESGRPSSRRVHFDDPYVDAKSMLLERVAAANRCSAVFSPEFGWSTVFGYDCDLDAVELLTASLLAQAAHALARHGARVDATGRSRTRSFRRAFLVGFAHRIGERLKGAVDTQVAAAGHANGRLLPVLAAREDKVRAAQEAAYPELVARRTAISNGAGWVAGTAAADLADLSAGAGALDRRRTA